MSLEKIAMGAKPDAHNFTIIDKEVVNGHTIVVAKYHGCLTFGGHKMMLLYGEPVINGTLDPHFLDDEHSVIARFKPTILGWRLARACAQLITK